MMKFDANDLPDENKDYIRRVLETYMAGLSHMTNSAIENIERAGVPAEAANVMIANVMGALSIGYMQIEDMGFSMETVNANREIQIDQARTLFETAIATKQ